uniref:Uncharacterized protein n=1 Tax=Ixodes ricinus TaxID=34613 RepID=A0A6B0U1J8_IXORI
MGPVAVGIHFIAATAAPGLSYAIAVLAECLHVACNAFLVALYTCGVSLAIYLFIFHILLAWRCYREEWW